MAPMIKNRTETGMHRAGTLDQDRKSNLLCLPMVSAVAIANKFIERAQRDRVPLTNMQLQKLVYIAHGWALALLNRDLIYDPVIARPWGPVIPSLFYSLSQYGAGEVTSTIPRAGNETLGPHEEDLIETVWNSYKDMSDFTLSIITHRKNTPWDRTVKEYGVGSVIPEKYMAEHYRHLYDEQIRRKREGTNPQPAR